MKNTNETSFLMKSIMAGLKSKRKVAQIDPSEEFKAHDETSMDLPEERHEVDIMFDMKKCIERIEDEEIKTELMALADELAAIHGIDKDVESLSDLDVKDLDVPSEIPSNIPSDLELDLEDDKHND